MNNENFVLNGKIKTTCFWGVFIGLLCFGLGLYIDPKRAWLNLLLNNFYFVSLGLGGLFFVSLQNVTNSSWSRPMSRITESFSSFLPISFLITLGLFLGIHSLFEWSHHEVVMNDPILKGKAFYLNTTFFIARTIAFFVVWILLGKLLSHFSESQDNGKRVTLKKVTLFSVLFLIFFAYSYSFFSFDMIMSLEPHWFSTIFGIYTFSGLFVNILAVLTLTIILLKEQGYLAHEINENHYHDLGKLLFGFSTFWAYIWFSQYVLIWYANIPEETVYFYLREHNTWDWLFYANLFINWLIPFFALMTRESKRRSFILKRVCIVLIIGHWLDLYVMIAPPIFKHAHVENPMIDWIEIGMALGFGALFILVLSRRLSKRKLIPANDLYLEEGIYLEQ